MTNSFSSLTWWQKATFYQIYPRSFADGNSDGIGDLHGMIAKLDYLKDLGVDAIWLSPHYPSPQFDCGYDIADYCDVAPEYGTLDDFRRFLDELHRRGMHLILDMVLNHTSDQHPWFLESKSSKDNPKRDWYVWRSGENGGPPNDWLSCFDGPAWEFDSTTGEYYYHYFFKQQPDLNWRNPEVKKAMFDACRFWLDMGVDGFRLDAIGTIFERPDLPNHGVNMTLDELRLASEKASSPTEQRYFGKLWGKIFGYQYGQPGMHELMKELRQVINEYDGDRLLVAEDENIDYQGDGQDELHLVFNFPLLRLERLTPALLRRNQAQRLGRLAPINGWPCNTLANHDCPRVLNRYGDGKNDQALARLSLATMLTLRGTPFLYNGEEIGMSDLYLNDPADLRDEMAIWYYRQATTRLGVSSEEAMHQVGRMTRDKNRTPLHWSNAPHGGFCPPEAKPWLPVHPNYAAGINVADHEQDPTSLLHFYRQLLALRRNTPALIAGDYQPLHQKSRAYLAFIRHSQEQTVLVVLNFSDHARRIDFSELGEVVQTCYASRQRTPKQIDLKYLPLEAFGIFIGELKS